MVLLALYILLAVGFFVFMLRGRGCVTQRNPSLRARFGAKR